MVKTRRIFAPVIFGALGLSGAIAPGKKLHKHQKHDHLEPITQHAGKKQVLSEMAVPVSRLEIEVKSGDKHFAGIQAHKHTSSVQKPYRQDTNGSTPTAWIQVGTPKKYLSVILDTGSDKLVAKTWETIAAELTSVDQGIDGMVLPSELLYNHNTSSSYKAKFMKDPATGKDAPMQDSITYGSGTAITDDGTETVLVGNRSLENFTIMEINADNLQMLHTSTGIAGILGLQHMKNKSLGNSLFSHMRDKDLMTAFGYCRGAGNNGTFIWGDDSTDGHELDVIGQMHWAMHMSNVSMPRTQNDSASLLEKGGNWHSPASALSWMFSEGGRMEEAAHSIGELEASGEMSHRLLHNTCPHGKCVAILDTGSNIIAGPTAAVKAISDLANVKPDCSNFDELPEIHLVLGDLPVKVPPSGYVMKVPMPEGGLGAYGDGDGMGGDGDGDGAGGEFDQTGDGDGGEPDAAIVIDGSSHMRNMQPKVAVVVEELSLAEKQAAHHKARTHDRWRQVFARLHRHHGVDLRKEVDDILQKHGNETSDQFMCMPALVPLDMTTSVDQGPLWIVGTPLLDAYYARWSFAKDAENPKIHLQPLDEASACKDDQTTEADSTDGDSPVLVRTAKKTIKPADRKHSRGPTMRSPEEISYPHWARDLVRL